MKKLKLFFEFGYLIIGIVLLVDGIYRFNQPGERNNSYFLIAFSVLAVFMFFFKRHFRRKFEARNSQNKNNQTK
ncbi:hypothetical protein EGM88_09885 [Aureibaculum marinum]|uniref:Uncharacterized protein n=1 Tax=Aureibaculum marinum TaxID=2487930 RepID=A0A3N4NKB1_9FLAO|nr:hypothetical protein [Aureibaculum marinum]RPD96661.1 hypothetical protein EGM88_09885 [Aureibaculum marinum]